MFITQAKEIMDACPTARLDAKDAQRLLRSVEEEEVSMLEPLLGERLMDYLQLRYDAYVKAFGGITTEKVDIARDDFDCGHIEEGTYAVRNNISIIRDIQSALVYRMFANKIYTISTSLNLGGGANRASAGDYDPADDKHMRELRSEFFHNSIRACDNILRRLEKDAKLPEAGDDIECYSMWKTMWMESDGYFLHEDLLFPSMKSIKPFVSCDQPTKYLTMTSLIRYCQDTYITPRVNEVAPGLMDRLLDVTCSLNDDERKAQKLLRQALAYYIKSKDGEREDRNESLMTADGSFSTAIDFVKRAFKKDEHKPEDNECKVSHDRHHDCVSERGYSTFCTLMPGVNRW